MAAEVNIQLTSDNAAVVSVPAQVTIPVGARSANVALQAHAIAGPVPPISVNVHATYVGKTLTASILVVPPRVVSLTLAPDTVTTGNNSTATVSLERASLGGPVVVDLICSTGFASVPAQVIIPQNQLSADFIVTTPAVEVPFKTASATIYATYAGSIASARLTVKSSVIGGILNNLLVRPATVVAGDTSHGTVSLIEAVPTPTLVGLGAVEPSPGHLPLRGNPSSLVMVPVSITIPAGDTVGYFNIMTAPHIAAGSRRPVTILANAVVAKYATLTVVS